jgi:hypothetical protein
MDLPQLDFRSNCLQLWEYRHRWQVIWQRLLSRLRTRQLQQRTELGFSRLPDLLIQIMRLEAFLRPLMYRVSAMQQPLIHRRQWPG